MTPEQYQLVKECFLAARELAEPERTARVAALAAGDPVVLERAVRMLAHDTSEMAEPAEGAVRGGLEGILKSVGVRTTGGVEAPLPRMVGQYEILRRIGSGGMGEVYEGLQETPRRRVAVKVMRSGGNAELMSRRFRREIEFVGRLSHPGIVPVYEAGMTELGGVLVPFYAMELVSGMALLEFVRQRGLGLEEKLRLFAAICDVVQYAHQQGVVHRDLKPANIMVQDPGAGTSSGTAPGEPARVTGGSALTATTSRSEGTGAADGRMLPRIMDFGIARAVELAGDAATLATEAGQIIGTVPYMSPEQIGGRGGEVDTRTDVYALGVILFEMLTGRLPFVTEGRSVVEAARIKSSEPAERLSAVDRSLRGDLETIIGKAMEVEKDRRYATASELAADVRRFLADEVILARPATMGYQFRKFTKRHRGAVMGAVVAGFAVVGGVVATALQAREAVNQRDLAQARAAEVQRQSEKVEQALAAVEREAKRANRKSFVAEAVSAILLDTLEQATPNVSPGKEPLLIEAIGYAEEQAYDRTVINSPEVQAVVLHAIGIIRRERGDLERADKALSTALANRRKVLAANDPNLADTLTNLGLLRKRQDRMSEAAALIGEAVEVQRRCVPQDQQRLGRNLYNLGTVRLASGDLTGAEAALDESLEIHRRLLGPEHEVIGLHLSAYARLAMAGQRWDVARERADAALALYRKAAGPDHPLIVGGLCDCARVRSRQGDRQGAIGLLEEAEAMAAKVYPREPEHPMAGEIRKELAELRGQGK